jgi:hypothetical protein
MLDYIFFNTLFSTKFENTLKEMNIPYQTSTDEEFGTLQGKIISIDEDTDEKILDKLQGFYDKLQDEQEVLLEQTDESLETNASGMEIDLSNGDKCTLRLPPEHVNKILSVLSFEELQGFVQLIANSVQNPDNNPFCQSGIKDE